MTLVNLLRFNQHMGAIISDEEYWNLQFRRRMYGDNLHGLVNEQQSELWQLEVVYGAVGAPAVHQEVIQQARARLQEHFKRQQKGQVAGLNTVKEVARIAFEALQAAIRRRIDQRLRYVYGFDTRDLHRGYFMRDGTQYPINTKLIKEQAQALATGEKSVPLLKEAMQCKAAVFGHDQTYGITAYHLSVDKWIMGYVHEGFECIGSGKYASGLSLGMDFKTKTLMMRQAGYAPAEGLLELIASATLADDHFKAVGGNLNLVLIDGSANQHARRYREIFDQRARLAMEIVRAYQANLLTRPDAIRLLDEAVMQAQPLAQVEEAFFQQADATALHFLLRGYKLKELDEIRQELNTTPEVN